MIRTHEAGTLRPEHNGATVTLAGWVAHRRDHGGVAFVDLRDASGIVQVVIRDPEVAGPLRNEFCLRIVGTVGARPEGNENPDLPTGAIEVTAEVVDVLSEAAPLPFQLDEHLNIGDETRLQYRYLDLRRAGPAKALRMRSQVNQIARNLLLDKNFVEVETPTLTRSTPEGARDFLVPVRLRPGSWYALPQSPQLFKQLLMVGGLERYFQIARCYRDEDFRADRQPEFTQLDVELSFCEQADIIELGESIVRALWGGILGVEIGPVPHLTYAEAMNRYGSDKPDLRYAVELTELTPVFAETSFRVFQAPYVGAVVMPGGASQSRKELDGWQDWAQARGAKGLAYVLVQEGGILSGPVARNLSDAEQTALLEAVGAQAGDCVFFAADERAAAQALLGAARVEIAARGGLADPDEWQFCWVVDAPMFEPDGEGGWSAVHHAFTSPNAEWTDTFTESPGEALAYAYDIVCNGNEIGGGSIRIHRADMQQKVFDVMGIGVDEAREKFGFLLDAFAFGPPPHGGIAFGWDRICMLLAGADSLREVIAFPKTGGGYDPLTGAPTPITPIQRREAGVDAQPPKPAVAG